MYYLQKQNDASIQNSVALYQPRTLYNLGYIKGSAEKHFEINIGQAMYNNVCGHNLRLLELMDFDLLNIKRDKSRVVLL